MKQKSVAAKIGTYLKYQREKRSLSLGDFAKLTSLDPSFIHRVERGYYNGLSFDAVEKIATGLNMSLEDLLAKCNITPSRFTLPTIEYYFKEQFQFPDEAIKDVKLFISFLEKKYKKDIRKMKEKHQQYWEKQKQQASKKKVTSA